MKLLQASTGLEMTIEGQTKNKPQVLESLVVLDVTTEADDPIFFTMAARDPKAGERRGPLHILLACSFMRPSAGVCGMTGQQGCGPMLACSRSAVGEIQRVSSERSLGQLAMLNQGRVSVQGAGMSARVIKHAADHA